MKRREFITKSSLAQSTKQRVVELQPGNYTVQVGGVANGTGIALIEVYEVP